MPKKGYLDVKERFPSLQGTLKMLLVVALVASFFHKRWNGIIISIFMIHKCFFLNLLRYWSSLHQFHSYLRKFKLSTLSLITKSIQLKEYPIKYNFQWNLLINKIYQWRKKKCNYIYFLRRRRIQLKIDKSNILTD